MVSWPAGHRIEDYQFKVYSKAFAWLGDLATVHGAAGTRTLYGQFGGKCTFELSLDDPWVAVLNAEEQHFLKVLRDGVQVFAGMQVKLEREDEPAKESGFVKFQFLPLAFLAKWRHCLAIAPATELEVTGVKADDGFKWIVERVLGSTAPNTPTTGLARAITGFVVAADKTEYPTNVTLNPTNQNLYEWLQRWGTNYDVDWDIYLNASDAPEFETWYPRRGLDRSEGNGTNTEAIFTDAMGDILRVSYGMDTTDAKTIILSADGSADVAAVEGIRTAWLIREATVRSRDTTTMQVALEDKRPKVWCKLEEYAETRGLQWREGAVAADPYFSVGDQVTWYSQRMGYGPNDDTICQIDWEIDANGFEHLTLTFGDPEPDITDKMRGGGEGANDPDYTDPGAQLRVLGITGTDTNTVHPAVGTNNWTFAAGTGIASITCATASTVTFNTVWQRGTGTGEASVYPADTGDALGLADDIYVYSDSIGGTQTFGVDSEGGGVLIYNGGYMHLGGMTTPAEALKVSHSATHPGIAVYSGADMRLFIATDTGSIQTFDSATLTMRGAADAAYFTVDGANGNTTWAPSAVLTMEALDYSPPASISAAGLFLQASTLSGSDVGLGWVAPCVVSDSEPATMYPGQVWVDSDGAPAANYWSRDGAVLYPTTSADNVTLRGGGDLIIYSDAAVTTKFSVDGATGNTIIKGTTTGYGTLTLHAAGIEVYST